MYFNCQMKIAKFNTCKMFRILKPPKNIPVNNHHLKVVKKHYITTIIGNYGDAWFTIILEVANCKKNKQLVELLCTISSTWQK